MAGSYTQGAGVTGDTNEGRTYNTQHGQTKTILAFITIIFLFTLDGGLEREWKLCIISLGKAEFHQQNISPYTVALGQGVSYVNPGTNIGREIAKATFNFFRRA